MDKNAYSTLNIYSFKFLPVKKSAKKLVGKAAKIKPRRELTAAIVIISFLLFYWLVSIPMNGVLKFFLSILLMGGIGVTFEKLYSMEGFFGMNLWRNTAGLKLIDKVSKKNPAAWKFLADVGLVLAFGASAKLLFKHVSWKTLFIGLASLLIFVTFVLPFVFPVALSVINFPVNFEQATGKVNAAAQSNDFLSATVIDVTLPLGVAAVNISFSGAQSLILAMILAGGFVLVSVLGLLLNGALILFSIIRSFQGDSTALAETAPGASFIIPGINIPFIEGILALSVLLVVHEGMHGILARIGDNKLLSTGLVFFGILPAGAFVEPDEKQLSKKSVEKQSRVIVAGSTANFLTAFIFFVLVFAFYFSTASGYEVGIGAVQANKTNLTLGSTLYSINGMPITDVSSFINAKQNITANSTITLVTSEGTFTQKLDENKSIGVLLQRQPKQGFGWLEFFYNFLALTFVLNFLVGSVNLLPIPLFDGYRLVDMGVKNELVTKSLAVLVVVSFLMNFLPWIWH